IVAISKNAEYIFLSNKSTYATVYARVGSSTYKKLDSSFQPTLSYPRIGGVAFSPDGKYFAAGTGGAAPAIKIWKIKSGNPFVAGGGNPLTSQAQNVATTTFSTISFPAGAAPQIAF